MNRISAKKQRQILELTAEGQNIRSIAKKVGVRWETAKKYHDYYNELIEEKSKEIESKFYSELDQLEKDGLPEIIKKLLHL